MDAFELAALLRGGISKSGTGSTRQVQGIGTPQVVSGTALSDSADGKVVVDLGGLAVTQDGTQGVEIDTVLSVREGQEVSVEIVGGKATATGVIGWGDGLASDVADAAALAEAAKAVADATAQNFWSDSDGAHVTQATQAEWQASHAGPNSLWNSLGMLFRDGLRNLLGILSGPSPAERGITVYDGEGNDASDIVASFTGAGSVIGKTTGQNVEIASGAISFRDALSTIVRVFNGSATSGFDFMTGGGLRSGFLRSGKNEQLMWLHGNDRVCIGTGAGSNPMRAQVQVGNEGVTFKGSAGRDVHIDLGDGSAGSGGRIVASELGNTPTSRIEQVAGRTGYGSPVDITGYGQSSPYTVPSDGIVWAEANWRANAYTQCIILSSAGTELFTVQQASPGTGSNASTTGQVFAGMRVYVNRNPSVPYGTARFIPYA